VGEIDVIAEHDGYTVFIEVKTRSGDEFGLPSEAVNKKKQEN
jgi:putative endonuclease